MTNKKQDLIVLTQNTEFVIIDVATTGFRPDVDAPVEIAAVRLVGEKVLEHKVWRLNPEVKIPPAASAHHELKDKHVEGCPLLEDVREDIIDFIGNRPIVMHNLSMGEPLDKAMVPFLSDSSWICNARLTKHLWPQMTESHGFPLANYDAWTLNYWLRGPNGGELDTRGAQVYETLANALATAFVFQKSYAKYLNKFKEEKVSGSLDDIDNQPKVIDLIKHTERPVEMTLMPKGPFKNCLMSDLEDDYFKTLIPLSRLEDTDRDFAHTIQAEADRRIKAKFNFSGGLRRAP
jgi:hypothetical protein